MNIYKISIFFIHLFLISYTYTYTFKKRLEVKAYYTQHLTCFNNMNSNTNNNNDSNTNTITNTIITTLTLITTISNQTKIIQHHTFHLQHSPLFTFLTHQHFLLMQPTLFVLHITPPHSPHQHVNLRPPFPTPTHTAHTPSPNRHREALLEGPWS